MYTVEALMQIANQMNGDGGACVQYTVMYE